MREPAELSERDIAAFWSRVDTRGPDDCWPWTAAKSMGYGAMQIGSKSDKTAMMTRSHRIAFFLAHGRWPDPYGLHDCPGGDNRLCCNPAHIFEGSHTDNIADMVAKARQSRGSTHGAAKLTNDDVIEMRRRHADGGVSHTALAMEYGVCRSEVSMIVSRRRWMHVA